MLKPEWLAKMADKPLIMALANPEPEIMPDVAKAARPDAVIATGRSDFPNQVNNVLCFPFIFRGALDVGATTINEAMKLACVRAIADLAMAEQSDIVAHAYNIENLRFGPEYLIPKPFDPRLIVMIAPAVAKAAMDSGVATRPIADFDAYKERLTQFVYTSGLLMKPIFTAAKKDPEAHRVRRRRRRARAARRAGRGGRGPRAADPGRPAGGAGAAHRALRPAHRRRARTSRSSTRSSTSATATTGPEYYRLTERRGVSQAYAQIEMRRRHTLIGAMMMHRGEADGMLCGTFGTHDLHRHYIDQVIGLRKGVRTYAAMNALMMPARTIFIADTYVNADPTAEQLAEITLLAAEEMRRFGITPKVAFLSHSSFGSSTYPTAKKMQAALAMVKLMDPELECEGEMHGDAALSEEVRMAAFPHAQLKGEANLLIMPTLDAANISFNLLKVSSGLRRDAGPDPARRGQAGAHPHAVGDGAPHRQHDGADRRGLHDAAAGATYLSPNSRLQHVAHDAMRERGLLPDFSPAVMAEADALTHAATAADAAVRDLRGLLWASIDNDDSRDLDQLSVAGRGRRRRRDDLRRRRRRRCAGQEGLGHRRPCRGQHDVGVHGGRDLSDAAGEALDRT